MIQRNIYNEQSLISSKSSFVELSLNFFYWNHVFLFLAYYITDMKTFNRKIS